MIRHINLTWFQLSSASGESLPGSRHIHRSLFNWSTWGGGNQEERSKLRQRQWQITLGLVRVDGAGSFLKEPLEGSLSFYSPGRWHGWPQAFLQANELKADVPLTTEATREGRTVERAQGEGNKEKVQPRRSQVASGSGSRHRREGA